MSGHVVITITRTAGANAVLSALFLDPSSAAPLYKEGDTMTVRFSGWNDPSSADRGSGLHFSIALDPALLATSYTDAGTATSAVLVLPDDGVQLVYGRVFDKDGGFTNLIARAQVAGVAPAATLSNNGPTAEGSPVTIAFSTPVDPSSADTNAGFRYSFARDPSELATSYYDTSRTQAQGSITPPTYDSGTFLIYGRVLDKDNLHTDATTTVVVADTAPTAKLSTTGPIPEGGKALVTLGGAVDPSPFDTKVGFHYSFATDPSDLATTYDQASSSNWANLDKFPDNGTYTLFGRILDQDSGYTDYRMMVAVYNVAPTATITNSGPVAAGRAVSISLINPHDPSTVDTSARFHYSFATTPAGLAGSYVAAGTGNSASFIFAQGGAYTIYGRIFDKDGGYTDYNTVVSVAVTPTIGDAGFEQPSAGPVGSLGSYVYDPTGTAWAFSGTAGVAANGSALTASNPAAPEGVQVGFLQRTGAFSQAVPGWLAGRYVISFDAAQRGNSQASRQDFQVRVDGAVVGTFAPSGTSHGPYTTAAFSVAAGSHTIAFVGLDSVGGDNTALVDDVAVVPVGTLAIRTVGPVAPDPRMTSVATVDVVSTSRST